MTRAALSEEDKRKRREYYHANKALCCARMKRWRVANADALKVSKKAYYEANKRAINDAGKVYARQYYEKNKERLRARERARRKQPKYKAINAEAARRKRVAEVAADRDAIRAIYERAQELSALTGILHHVDHIVPLKHPLVCGLHNQFNLRVITAEENMRKKNKLIEAIV